MSISEQALRKLHFSKKTKYTAERRVIMEDLVASEGIPEKIHGEVGPSGKKEGSEAF